MKRLTKINHCHLTASGYQSSDPPIGLTPLAKSCCSTCRIQSKYRPDFTIGAKLLIREYVVDDKDKQAVDEALTKHGDLIPDNFVRTAPAYQKQVQYHNGAVNPQVTSLLTMIGVATPESTVQTSTLQTPTLPTPNPEEIELDL